MYYKINVTSGILLVFHFEGDPSSNLFTVSECQKYKEMYCRDRI